MTHRMAVAIGMLNLRLVPVVNRRRFACGARALARNPPDDNVKDRREEDAEDGDAQHAGKDGESESDTHFSAGAFRQNQRHDTQKPKQRVASDLL